MKKFEFRVRQNSIAAGKHSWQATELEAPCDPIALLKGGLETAAENLVGKYPEIEDHLSRVHGIDIALTYVPSMDIYEELSDGNYKWTFRRRATEVIVHDIPRVLASVTLSGPAPVQTKP